MSDERFNSLEVMINNLTSKVEKLIDSLPDRYCTKELCLTKMDTIEQRVQRLEEKEGRATWALLGVIATVLWAMVRQFLGI